MPFEASFSSLTNASYCGSKRRENAQARAHTRTRRHAHREAKKHRKTKLHKGHERFTQSAYIIANTRTNGRKISDCREADKPLEERDRKQLQIRSRSTNRQSTRTKVDAHKHSRELLDLNMNNSLATVAHSHMTHRKPAHSIQRSRTSAILNRQKNQESSTRRCEGSVVKKVRGSNPR